MIGRLPPGVTSALLTRVELLWIEKQVERWIRFGREVEEVIHDRSRRVLGFAPGSVFAYVRWAANDHGTLVSRIDIARAVFPGEPFSTLPYVQPGADILLRQSGWPKVETVLQHVDAVEALGLDAAEVAPDHWHHLHHRMQAGQPPRAYTLARHQAWLKRREVGL